MQIDSGYDHDMTSNVFSFHCQQVPCETSAVCFSGGGEVFSSEKRQSSVLFLSITHILPDVLFVSVVNDTGRALHFNCCCVALFSLLIAQPGCEPP